MSKDESSLTDTLKNRIQPLDKSQWDDSVDAMHNYLTLLKKHSEVKAEAAQEKLEEHEEDLEALKKRRRKRRNYGTRTGIIMDDGTDNSFEVK